MLQIHHANGSARVLQVAVADRITDVTQHILKLREVVSLRHVVWIVIPETNPKFIIGILPIRVRYAHRRFVLSSHIIPHIGVFVADGIRPQAASYLVDVESMDALFDQMDLSRDIEISRREFAEGKGIPNEQVERETREMLARWFEEDKRKAAL